MKICPECQTHYSDEIEFCAHDGMKLRQPRRQDEDPMLGRVLEGRWVIEKKIGEGGMGDVYKGSQRSVNRPVAIKTLRPNLVENEEFIDRFFREAKLATTINHPNCVTILDFGQTEDDILYLAMEFLEGMPLTDRLETGEPLSLEHVLQITDQIAAALEAAHAQNIIHRDLKPDNIFLQETAGQDLHAKLLDFGIAKDAGAQTQYTRTGQIFGTPTYMSPEQCSGEVLDGRSDLYALGCIMYELLCGTPPFDADNSMAILMAHVAEQPRPLRERADVPAPVEQLVLRLLHKDREQRPADASQLRQLIKDVRVRANVTGLNMQQVTGAQHQLLGTMDTMAAAGGGIDALRAPSGSLPQLDERFAPAEDSGAYEAARPSPGKKLALIGVVLMLAVMIGGAAIAVAVISARQGEDIAQPQHTLATSEPTSELAKEAPAEPVEPAKQEEPVEEPGRPAETTAQVPAVSPRPSRERPKKEEVAVAPVRKKTPKAPKTEKEAPTAPVTSKPEEPKKTKKSDAPPRKIETNLDVLLGDDEDKKNQKKKDIRKKLKDKSDAIVDGLF